jgi:uncharacterized protein (DUF302 family)
VIVTVASGDVERTEAGLRAALERHGLALLARVDHAAGARRLGLELEETRVLSFGNPRAGTPLMAADRRVGLELPLRMLIWEQDGETRLGYEDPRELAGRFELAGHEQRLEAMAELLATLAAEAGG